MSCGGSVNGFKGVWCSGGLKEWCCGGSLQHTITCIRVMYDRCKSVGRVGM